MKEGPPASEGALEREEGEEDAWDAVACLGEELPLLLILGGGACRGWLAWSEDDIVTAAAAAT